jgi:hypothetical protein
MIATTLNMSSTPPSKPNTRGFAFVNISKPADSSQKANRDFVREYVRSVRELPGITTSSGAATKEKETEKDLDEPILELRKGELNFVTVSHPKQMLEKETRKFVRKNVQPKVKFSKRVRRGQEQVKARKNDEASSDSGTGVARMDSRTLSSAPGTAFNLSSEQVNWTTSRYVHCSVYCSCG